MSHHIRYVSASGRVHDLTRFHLCLTPPEPCTDLEVHIKGPDNPYRGVVCYYKSSFLRVWLKQVPRSYEFWGGTEVILKTPISFRSFSLVWNGVATLCGGCGDPLSSWRNSLVERGIKVIRGLGVSLCGQAFVASQGCCPGRDLVTGKHSSYWVL